MLIPVVDDYYDPGYLPDGGPAAVRGFFPNCNLGVRRSAWTSVGGYDEGLAAAEDMDLCRRVSLDGWRLYFEPRAACRHRARSDLGALARQWWGYGVASAEVQAKRRDAAVELYASSAAAPRIHGFRRLLAIERSPVKALVFVTPFRAAGLFAAAAVAAVALGQTIVAALLLGLSVVAGGSSVVRHPATRMLRLRDLPGLLVVLTVLDLASLLGGLCGGLRCRMLYVSAVV